MAAYSIDLQLRVLRDADAGLPSDELAEKYSVSRAWVDRLKQRRRETGEVAPRKQTRWRTPILQAQLAELVALRRGVGVSHSVRWAACGSGGFKSLRCSDGEHRIQKWG